MDEELQEIKNEAGGIAYRQNSAETLTQLAVTGCLNRTFYASADAQLNAIINLCSKTDPERVAKIAVYAREKGYMKEVPALLCVWLAANRQNYLLNRIFSRVIDNGKMLRNFVKILRSGSTGRKSLGTLPKRLVAGWFDLRTTKEIFQQSVGNDPSFRDILRLSHPKPLDRTKNALYRWFLGREYDVDDLPDVVRQFEDYKSGRNNELPPVPFEMLTAMKLGQSDWCQIAMRAKWHWLRMNLNTMQRHKVFDIPEMVDLVANRLTDKESIQSARVFPYQLMAAYKNVGHDIPHKIREALQDALEVATENVPQLRGNGYVFIDVSQSMNSPMTGEKKGSTSKVRCVDVAGLIGSTVLRKNPSSHIIPFNNTVQNHNINPRDTVITNAEKLAAMLGGGTNCSSPLVMLNEKNATGDWVILVSDNQSWVDTIGDSVAPMFGRSGSYYNSGGHTKFMQQWDIFKGRNPHAKLVAIDIQPYQTTQTQEREDILNVGGMGDLVFDMANSFFNDEMSANHWIGVIDAVEL